MVLSMTLKKQEKRWEPGNWLVSLRFVVLQGSLLWICRGGEKGMRMGHSNMQERNIGFTRIYLFAISLFFFSIFSKFSQDFEIFGLFEYVQTHSDLFSCIRVHLNAYG